jgi:hypothetical protein
MYCSKLVAGVHADRDVTAPWDDHPSSRSLPFDEVSLVLDGLTLPLWLNSSIYSKRYLRNLFKQTICHLVLIEHQQEREPVADMVLWRWWQKIIHSPSSRFNMNFIFLCLRIFVTTILESSQHVFCPRHQHCDWVHVTLLLSFGVDARDPICLAC